MPTVSIYTSEILAVDCPYLMRGNPCRGTKGKRCLSAWGHQQPPHKARVKLAEMNAVEPSQEPIGEEPVRVVLVKPGEVLIVGGIGGDFDTELLVSLAHVFQRLGIETVFMETDITIGKTTQMAWKLYSTPGKDRYSV